MPCYGQQRGDEAVPAPFLNPLIPQLLQSLGPPRWITRNGHSKVGRVAEIQ